jgi:hypothetical protein
MISGIGCFVSSAITLFVSLITQYRWFPHYGCPDNPDMHRFSSLGLVTHEAGYTTRMLSAMHLLRHCQNTITNTISSIQHIPKNTILHTNTRCQDINNSLPLQVLHINLGRNHPTADGRPEAFVRSSHEMYHDEWMPRGSAELTTEAEEVENSPVYESDLDELSSDTVCHHRDHRHTS